MIEWLVPAAVFAAAATIAAEDERTALTSVRP